MKIPVIVATILAALTPGFAAGTPETPKAAPAAKTPALPQADTAYELRGFFGSGDSLEVSLVAKGEKDSRWYAVGKKTSGILVEKADSAAGYAILNRNGVRSTVRLATAGAPVAAEDKETDDADVKPDLNSREYRRKRFKEMMEKSSPAQQAEFQRVMMEKFTAMRTEHPEYFTDFKNPDNRKKVGDASLAIMHDAAEASAKIPGKDGKVNPLPEDFDALMRAEHNANMQRWNSRENDAPKETKPADEAGK